MANELPQQPTAMARSSPPPADVSHAVLQLKRPSEGGEAAGCTAHAKRPRPAGDASIASSSSSATDDLAVRLPHVRVALDAPGSPSSGSGGRCWLPVPLASPGGSSCVSSTSPSAAPRAASADAKGQQAHSAQQRWSVRLAGRLRSHPPAAPAAARSASPARAESSSGTPGECTVIVRRAAIKSTPRLLGTVSAIRKPPPPPPAAAARAPEPAPPAPHTAAVPVPALCVTPPVLPPQAASPASPIIREAAAAQGPALVPVALSDAARWASLLEGGRAAVAAAGPSVMYELAEAEATALWLRATRFSETGGSSASHCDEPGAPSPTSSNEMEADCWVGGLP